jgi:predicted DCC family thiol-disulfide oxidoreductase YuxK
VRNAECGVCEFPIDYRMSEAKQNGIILFDGVCNFCNSSVNFIIDHDAKDYFKFAALQSEAGEQLQKEYGINAEDKSIDSVLLIEEGKLYTHSTAALRIARNLKGIWSLLYVFIIFPKPLRDFFYKRFAKNRYRLFGKRDACRLPSPEERAKFL